MDHSTRPGAFDHSLDGPQAVGGFGHSRIRSFAQCRWTLSSIQSFVLRTTACRWIRSFEHSIICSVDHSHFFSYAKIFLAKKTENMWNVSNLVFAPVLAATTRLLTFVGFVKIYQNLQMFVRVILTIVANGELFQILSKNAIWFVKILGFFQISRFIRVICLLWPRLVWWTCLFLFLWAQSFEEIRSNSMQPTSKVIGGSSSGTGCYSTAVCRPVGCLYR